MKTIKRQIIRQIASRTSEPKQESKKRFLSTGSTILNLALSGKHDKGFLLGKVANVIGDSSSGKTLLVLTMLAEAANNPVFDKHLLIYDDAEAACEFDIENLFGKKTAQRVLPPNLDKENPEYSRTLTAFQYNVRRLLKKGKPIIYIQDSFDALTTKQEQDYAEATEKAFKTGKEMKGTYGMEKAKQASVLLRLLVADAKATDSLIIIISQTRDNIDPMSFQKRTRAGGKALYFYCSYEMWLAIAQKLKVKVGEKKRQVGVLSKIKITKNKHSGKTPEVDVPMYYSVGIDDVGSCVDFLVSEGYWKQSGGFIEAKEISDKKLYRNKLIQIIEKDNQEPLLRQIVEKVWNEIEEQTEIKRKKRWE